MSEDLIETTPSREINYNKIIGTILSRWYWIAGCLAVTITLAWLYLSAIHPRYPANGSLMLTEKKSDIASILSNGESEKSGYEAFNLSQSATFIIQSNDFLSRAVSRLNYRYSFYIKDFWSYEELYPESPFHIEIIHQDSVNFYHSLLSIARAGKGKFSIAQLDSQAPARTYSYGEVINLPGVTFRIISSYAKSDQTYYFRFHTRESLVQRAANGLSLDPQSGSILSISHTDVNPYFSANLVNEILKEYVVYESAHRRISASQKLKFIDNQLDTLSKQVNISASDLEKFKKSNGMDNLPAKVQNDYAKLLNLQNQREQLNIESMTLDRFEQQIAVNDNRARINFNLEGNLSGMLSSLVNRLNDQIYERNDKLLRYTENSPTVQESDRKLEETKDAIAINIRKARQRTEEMKRYLDSQIASAKSVLEALPSDAKDFIDLQLEYSIRQKIFSNLTEERLKSSIALSAIEPGASIIYSANPSSQPAWPVPKRIYLIAGLAGLLGGLGLILLARFVNRRIRDIGTVENMTTIPILGLIRKTDKRVADDQADHCLLISEPDSFFSESVRSLRNNLLFTLNEAQGKVICVSSEIGDEGRSFIADNLACSLAQLDKKIIVVNADLRKSGGLEEIGLSAYLAGHKTLPAVIKHTDIGNMDMIPSGIAPPNPAELLQNQKMDELLSFLKNIYDYVVIDTSPVGVVSDAIPLIEKADLNLYIIRSGKSGYNSTSQIEKIAFDYKLENVFLVLNCFKKNPLYQPFYSDINTDIYFNNNYSVYLKQIDPVNRNSRWRTLSRD